VPTQEELNDLRRQGVNLLVSPAEIAPDVWELADHWGFFVLTKVALGTKEACNLLENCTQHPSHLGWLGSAEFVDQLPVQGLRGIFLDALPPAGQLPPDVRFIACAPQQVPSIVVLGRPMLVYGAPMPAAGATGVLGIVDLA
jgi:hypothetical protein